MPPANKVKSLKFRKLHCGVGLNDADFVTQRLAYTDENGVYHKPWRHPVYRAWEGLISRLYSEKVQLSNPSYVGKTMSEDWLKFTNFYYWAENQDYEGKCLDKDILGDGSHYSEETCCFVSRALNSVVVGINEPVNHENLRGVVTKLNRFQAKISEKKISKNLGSFKNKYEAYLVYCKAKLSLALKVLEDEGVEDYIASALIAKLQKKVDEAEILYQQSLI